MLGRGRPPYKGVAASVKKPIDAWARLAAAAKRPNASSERDEIRWASAYIYSPLDEIPIDAVPSVAAVSLLRAFRESPTDLFKSMYAKILPSKEEVNRVAKRSDDGDALTAHIDAVAELASDSEAKA